MKLIFKEFTIKESMSLLEKIKQQRTKLTPTETIVKLISGDVIKENRSAEGVTGIERLPIRSAGFVVDTKPDLQVAKIIDGLYMGSQDVAYDRELLNKNRIKNILSVGIKVSDRYEDISYAFVEALDTPEFNMSSVFDRTYDIISDIIDKRRESVYVHCNAGISRSASVVIAFLIKKNQISYADAYKRVKSARNIIKPNEGFVKQLILYESSVNIK